MRDKHYEIQRKEIINFLEKILNCKKLDSVEKLKNSRFLVIIGYSHFYLVNSGECKLENNHRKIVYFSYDAVIKNICISSQDPTKIYLEDMTEKTKEYNKRNLNKKVGDFKVENIYVAPENIEELIIKEMLVRKAVLERMKRKNEKYGFGKETTKGRNEKYYCAFLGKVLESKLKEIH